MSILLDNFNNLIDSPQKVTIFKEFIVDLVIKNHIASYNKNEIVNEGLFNIPSNWEWSKIGDIALVKGGKRLPKGHKYSENPTEHIYLRVTDFKDMSVDMSDLHYLSSETHELIERYNISKDDLYISIAGTIGKVGLIPGKLNGVNLTENAAKITKISNKIDKVFLAYLLNSFFCQQQIKSFITSSNQPKLALFRIKKIRIPIPPLDEQKIINKKIDDLFRTLNKLYYHLKNQQDARSAYESSLIQNFQIAENDKFENLLELFLENFNDTFFTLRSIEVLKKLLFDFAFHGKLTKQDPLDKDAHSLLKTVMGKKKILNSKGKIKNSKKGNEEGIPYELPKGWEWATLEDIAQINPRLPKKLDDNKNVSFLPMKAVKEISGKFDLSSIKKFGEVKKGYTSFINNDIIFAKITPCMENGKIAIVDGLENGIGFGSTEFHVIRLFEGGILKNYIFFYLVQERFRENAQQKMTGTSGHLRVPTNYMKNVKIPIPPLNEQKRIVTRIEQITKIIDDLEEAILYSEKCKEDLLKSLLKSYTISDVSIQA